MLAWLRRSRTLRQTARFLYGSIVTAARQRVFYEDWGIPDTVAGRLEMILLHLCLAQRRLGAEGEEGLRLARALSEVFVVDMDDAMREMTFGDLSVPRQARRAATALFDRWGAFRAALAEGDDHPLEEALREAIAYLDPQGRIDRARLARYMRRAAEAIDAEPTARILAGEFPWPSGGAV
jgi:cytochrome b pre-mRNA-processing protein 3